MVTEAPSDGWKLIYYKGSEGEQLEFVKAIGPVKQRFGNALEERRRTLVSRFDVSRTPGSSSPAG